MDEHDKRDKEVDIDSKSDRFGEFHDSEESNKRIEKDIRFDKERVKPSPTKSAKKIDLGAAAFYKGEPTSLSVHIAVLLSPIQTLLHNVIIL